MKTHERNSFSVAENRSRNYFFAVGKKKRAKSQKELKGVDVRIPVTPSFKKEWEAFCRATGESSASQGRAAIREYMLRYKQKIISAVSEVIDGATDRGTK